MKKILLTVLMLLPLVTLANHKWEIVAYEKDGELTHLGGEGNYVILGFDDLRVYISDELVIDCKMIDMEKITSHTGGARKTTLTWHDHFGNEYLFAIVSRDYNYLIINSKIKIYF